jgi:hypothetical protein
MVIGILLTLLGVLTYVFWKQLGASHASVTALIPAFVGVPLMVLGWLVLLKPALRMHLMHAAVVLGLLGFLAALGGFGRALAKGLYGASMAATAIMAVLCGVYVALCVRSFIAARRARESSPSP